MLPNRVIALALLQRGLSLWVVTRIAVSGVLAYAGRDPRRLDAGELVTVSLLCVALGYIETARNRERDLLGNMGIRRRDLALLFLTPVIAGECAVRAVVAWL
jgi:hypothetical protein